MRKENAAWLLLIHQIPPKPESFRVKMWRALQKAGALQLKNSVYILPPSAENQLKFAGFVAEIMDAGGEAFLCTSEFILGIDRKVLIAQFNDDREDKYGILAAEARILQKQIPAKGMPSEASLMAVEHAIGRLLRQLHEVIAIDFFRSKAQAPTVKLLSGLGAKIDRLRGGAPLETVPQRRSKDFQGRTWVTRADVHVDRLASAWLIEKFIDKEASYKFVTKDGYKCQNGEIRFDMFQGEFTHIGDRCTFEVLVAAFSLKSPAIKKISEIIHDLDLRDTKFNRPENAGIEIVLRGIAKRETQDLERIKQASAVFEDLYASFESAEKQSR